MNYVVRTRLFALFLFLTPVDVTTTILPMSEGLTPTSLKALLATSVASGKAHSANRWNRRSVFTLKLKMTHERRSII